MTRTKEDENRWVCRPVDGWEWSIMNAHRWIDRYVDRYTNRYTDSCMDKY